MTTTIVVNKDSDLVVCTDDGVDLQLSISDWSLFYKQHNLFTRKLLDKVNCSTLSDLKRT